MLLLAASDLGRALTKALALLPLRLAAPASTLLKTHLGRKLLVSAATLMLGAGGASAQGFQPSVVTWEDVAKLARASAPALVLSQADVEVAEAQVAVATVLPNPELGYVGYARVRGNAVAINATQHQAQVQQPLLVFGQRGSRRTYARALANVAQERVAVSRLESLRGARHAFISLLAAQRNAEILLRHEQQMRSLFEVVETRAAAGSQSRYDALRVEVELAQLSSRREQAEAQLGAASVGLALELGKSDWEPQAQGELTLGQIEGESAWTQVRGALPAVRAAEKQVAANGAFVELARAERLPVPSLTAGGYWTTDGASSSVVFGAAVPLPVWNTGRASIEAAEAGRRSAQLAQRVIEAQAKTRLAGAGRLLKASREAFEVYERGAIQKLPRLREMADAAYKAGAVGILVLLDASRSTAEIELRRLEVLEAVMHAEAEALAAAGML